MSNILVFGDSIAAGMWDLEGGWVERLRKHLYKRVIESNLVEYHEVHNLSVSGDTSEDIINRFENEMKARLWEDPQTLIIFQFGTNDSAILIDLNKNWVPENIFSKNIKKLSENAKYYSNKVFFIGLTPVDESKINPIPWDKGKAYLKSEVEKYDNIIENFCKDNGLNYIKLYDKLTINELADGVHPNTMGHTIIYEKVNSLLLL
jgi:lysophospholipase L1-like esterase